jgi:hypothetical protein
MRWITLPSNYHYRLTMLLSLEAIDDLEPSI